MKPNYGRHCPAFVLLFLAKESTYGSRLLSMMEESLPFKHMDGPAIYRTLNELEKIEAVSSYWDTASPGPAKKCYTITPKGQELLEEYKIDVEQRKSNFEYFLEEYAELKKE